MHVIHNVSWKNVHTEHLSMHVIHNVSWKRGHTEHAKGSTLIRNTYLSICINVSQCVIKNYLSIMHIRVHCWHDFMYVCMCVCVYVCMYVLTCTYECTVDMISCMYVCMYVCMNDGLHNRRENMYIPSMRMEAHFAAGWAE
jgi:hypothetical protein